MKVITLVFVCVAFIFVLIINPNSRSVNAEERPTRGKSVSLRGMLKRDFGYDLKISGGFGQSRNDPIIVVTTDPVEASMTEMLVLRGLGKGRGILWRTLARTPMKHNEISLEQVKIETIMLTDSEIITQRENYYFDVSASTRDGKILPHAIGYNNADSGVNLPFEIGWLHSDGIIDNEPKHPGLGQSVAYGARGIKATIYIYDKRRGAILKDASAASMKDEFSSATSELKLLHPKAKALGNVVKKGSMLYQSFEIDEVFSDVALTVKGGKFIKVRISYEQDPLLVELVNQSLAAFQDEVDRRVNQENSEQ